MIIIKVDLNNFPKGLNYNWHSQMWRLKMFSQEKFSKEELYNLYKLEIERENEIRARWRNSFNVYLTMLLSIISGMLLLANFLSDFDMVSPCFTIGGCVVIALSIIAWFHFRLDYRYQMEILSIQAKIEDMLGLTSPERCDLPQRWGNEALLPPWYYSEKNIPSSSEKFVKRMCSIRNINFYPAVYMVFIFLGTALMILGSIIGQATNI